MELVRILILLFALFAWSRVVINLKTRKFSLLEFIIWSLIWLSLIVFVLFPTLLGYLRTLFGTTTGTGLLVYLAIIVLFYMIYRLSFKIDEQRSQITKLIRKIAIITNTLEKFEKKNVRKTKTKKRKA